MSMFFPRWSRDRFILMVIGVTWSVGAYTIPTAFGDEDAPKQVPAQMPRLVEARKDRALRAALPRVEMESIQEILNDPALILYTDEEMPPAYQIWDGDLQGIHSPDYNISADGGEPHGNGNEEFPWSTPAGTHNSPGVTTFRFMRLPVDEQGHIRPVVWHKTVLPGDTSPGYGWTFPVGTVFGEVLRLRSPEGENIPFEMRMRFREQGNWEVEVFRPFPTSADLAARIRELRPEWQKREKLAQLMAHLEGESNLPLRTLSSRHPGRTVFRQTAGVDSLPSAGDDALIKELLTTTPFQPVSGKVWKEGSNGVVCHAPTTKAAFHIIPAKYTGGFMPVDSVSCARCHDSVNAHVDNFDFSRDWYGRVRGSDGIFSFHPFEPSIISHNGFFSGGVQMRSSLTKLGLLQRFNGRKHPRSIYHSLEKSRL